jgi:hypothetical protein
MNLDTCKRLAAIALTDCADCASPRSFESPAEQQEYDSARRLIEIGVATHAAKAFLAALGDRFQLLETLMPMGNPCDDVADCVWDEAAYAYKFTFLDGSELAIDEFGVHVPAVIAFLRG